MLVFSLTGWCRQIHAGFHRSRATQDTHIGLIKIRLQVFHLLWNCFPDSFDFLIKLARESYYPKSVTRLGLGCSAFARHYLRNHCCFLFLRLLRCFSSAGWPSLRIYRVAPFGDLRIEALLQLPVAFRSFSRPSSPSHAKASTIRPFLL